MLAVRLLLFAVYIFVIYFLITYIFNWLYFHEIKNLKKMNVNETGDLHKMNPLYFKSANVKSNKERLVDAKNDITDPYYSFSNKGHLYDYKLMKPTTFEKINESGESIFEQMGNWFRFRMKCNAPFVAHKDIPWHCFPNPCGEKSHYDMNSKICVCNDGYENEYFNNFASKCYPKGYRQYYNNNTEILTIRSPCINDQFSKFENIPYPCESNGINVNIEGILLRFPENTETIENKIKLFKV